MSTTGLPSRPTSLRRLILVAAGFVVIADQASKSAALAILGDGERSFGPLRFVIVRNPGGPFGVATGASLAWTALTLAIVIAALVAVGTDGLHIRPAVAVGAVIGGGIGNLVDRLVRYPGGGRGAVIDWIAVDPYSRVFNLADVALRVGALVLLVAVLVGRSGERSAQREVEPEPPGSPTSNTETSNTEKKITHMVRADNPSSSPSPRRSFLARLRRGAATLEAAPVVDLDDESFFDAIEGRVTVADFWAPWCEPCKVLHPLFDDLARSHSAEGELQFARVDVDASPGVATALDIMSIPTLIVFDRFGREIEREIGVPGKRRLEQIARDARSAAALDETSEEASDERGMR